MRLVVIADAYAPMRTSGAVQLEDLAVGLVAQGHHPTVVVPSDSIRGRWVQDKQDGVEIVRLRSMRSKDVGYVRRTAAELVMPYSMLYNLRNSPLAKVAWDGVIWYSPSIFFGPIVDALKRRSGCRSYLIVRDIFPEWAVDMGLMRRGIAYQFFKAVENYQYSVANVIGTQTEANMGYFSERAGRPGQRVEVLRNWLAPSHDKGCCIRLERGPVGDRKFLVYAGNMGVAQGITVFLEVAERLKWRSDIGFVFVGRGSEARGLRLDAERRGLTNVMFFDEIDPSEIPGLYAQCHAGIIALDPRHKTHNIPGKFLSYMQSGLPVLAMVNPGNDLGPLIEAERVGAVTTLSSPDTLTALALDLLDRVVSDRSLSDRCKALSERMFSVRSAVAQIVAGLSYEGGGGVAVS